MEDTRSGSGRDGCRKERERYNGEVKVKDQIAHYLREGEGHIIINQEQEEIAVPCDAEQGIEEELHVAAQRLHASWTVLPLYWYDS